MTDDEKTPLTREEQAQGVSSQHKAVFEVMKGQLIIAMVKRMGGAVIMPVQELDQTGDVNLMLRHDPATQCFMFTVEPKVKT